MSATSTERFGRTSSKEQALPTLDPRAWLERATAMLEARPGVTLAAAVGAGFVLGATAFTRVGRLIFLAALGVAGEVLLQQRRASVVDEANPSQ